MDFIKRLNSKLGQSLLSILFSSSVLLMSSNSFAVDEKQENSPVLKINKISASEDIFQSEDIEIFKDAMEKIDNKEFTDGFKIMKKLAKKGYTEAKYYLGVAYQDGNGVEKDINKALKFYKQAADDGHKFAQYNLGLAYWLGYGVKTSKSNAEKYWTMAAENGLDAAQFNLGSLYYSKEGSKKRNLEKASYWYKKASEQNYEKADLMLDKIKQAQSVASSSNTKQSAIKKILNQGNNIKKRVASNTFTNSTKAPSVLGNLPGFGQTLVTTPLYNIDSKGKVVEILSIEEQQPVKIVNTDDELYEVLVSKQHNAWVYGSFVSQFNGVSYINSDRVRIRSKPSTGSDSVILGQFEENEKVEIVTLKDGWYSIRRQGEIFKGWIEKKHVEIFTDIVPITWLNKWHETNI